MADHTTAWEKLDDWIKQAIELGATDLHLVPNYKPMGRIKGELQPLDELVLTREMTHWVGVCLHGNQTMYEGGPGYWHVTRTYGDKLADITTASAGGAKTITVRFHGGKIPTIEETNLPEKVTELLKATHGIVLVGGPHGSGKTTTLYSLLDWINRNRSVHICTVEKPRWFILQPAKALVQQHEVGLDGYSFSELLTVSLRQAPNVLMIGEVEDFDTLASVIHAAETGHLVFVQVHARDAADAVNRFLQAAPEGMQEQVKRQLRETLRGVTMQRLAKRADGKGRVAVYDILNESVRKLVDGVTPDAGFFLARANDQIETHEKAGTITREEAERLRHEFGA